MENGKEGQKTLRSK